MAIVANTQMPLKRVRVLLVEDSEASAAMVCDSLTRDGQIELVVARTLTEARLKVAEILPELVIADLMLPDGKGTELLPESGAAAAFPVVILTGSGNEREAVEAMKAGAFDYLAKSAETIASIPHVVRRALREWDHIVRREKAERALREEEARLHTFFNSSAMAMVIISPGGEFLTVNPACCRIFGYSVEELLRLTVRDVIHPEDRSLMLELYSDLISGRKSVIEYDKRYLRKDGSPFWGSATVAGVHDHQGNLIYFAGQMQDVTARKEAEEALRESEERFRTVFTTAAAGMIIISPEGRILQVNPALCRFVDRSESELLGLTIEDITHPEDRDLTAHYYGEIFSNKLQHLHYEKRYLRKNGQAIWGHASVACVMGPGKKPLYCVGLVQDISDRKMAEDELRRANRELDAFVRTVSHDLRSPLTPILGYAEFLLEHKQESFDEQEMAMLGEIHRQGKRMLCLLEDLLALARVGTLEQAVEPVESSLVVDEVVAGLSGQIMAAGVEVRKGEMPALRMPQTLLAQLFDNLIGNALRYGGTAGGVIEVGGERHGVRTSFYVRDHGKGIPPEERERIFDLFYRGSSSANVDGTGVGLATVQKIAELFGGRAWVEETPGGGSTFRVEVVDETSC